MSSLFVALAMMVAAPGPKADAPAPSSLEGDWVVTNYVLGGNEDAEVKGRKVRIGDGKLVFACGEEECTYKTDKKADPAQIDLTAIGSEDEMIEGIYKLDKTTVTLCFPKGGRGDRPAKFESAAGTQVVLIRLEWATKKK
jgi:uncharacterized protein (TIGR03067 family)